MEYTIAVILIVVCMACYSEANAKTNTAGNRLNGDFNELSSNELSTEIDNCHEACLQKVCFPRHLLKIGLEIRFTIKGYTLRVLCIFLMCVFCTPLSCLN